MGREGSVCSASVMPFDILRAVRHKARTFVSESFEGNALVGDIHWKIGQCGCACARERSETKGGLRKWRGAGERVRDECKVGVEGLGVGVGGWGLFSVWIGKAQPRPGASLRPVCERSRYGQRVETRLRRVAVDGVLTGGKP